MDFLSFYQPHDAWFFRYPFFPGTKNRATRCLAVVCKLTFQFLRQKRLVNTILAFKKQYLLQTELYTKVYNIFMIFGPNLNTFAIVNTYAIDFLGIDTV